MDAKEFLRTYDYNNKCINRTEECIEQLLADVEGGSVEFKERVQTSIISTFDSKVSDIVDLKDELIRRKELRAKMFVNIFDLLSKMKTREYELLLIYRYIDGLEWYKVANKLNVSYRTVHRKHAEALQEFNMILAHHDTLKYDIV